MAGEKPSTDAFDMAFAAASQDDPLPTEDEPVVTPDPAEPAPVEDEPDATPDPADPADPADPVDDPADPADPADDPADPEDEVVPEAKMTDEQLLERFASIVQKKPAAPEPEPQPAPKADADPEPALYSDQEQELIKSYEKDWPEVAQAEALKRRGEYRMLVQHVFSEVTKTLQPLMETVDTMSTRTHLSELQSTVEDYEDIRDKVVEWVDTQPAYLQSAYNHVIQKGTVEEVADLINRYRAASGQQAPSAKPAAPAQQQQKKPELPTAAKKAAAALAPVSTKRSAVVQPQDPADFDAAFEEFAAKT